MTKKKKKHVSKLTPGYMTILLMIFIGLVFSTVIFTIFLNPRLPKYQYIEVQTDFEDESRREIFDIRSEFSNDSESSPNQNTLKLNYKNDLFFNYHPSLALWILSFCILIAFSFGTILPVKFKISTIYNHFKLNIQKILFKIAPILLIVIITILGSTIWVSVNKTKPLLLIGTSIMDKLGLIFNYPFAATILLILLAGIGSFMALIGFLVIGITMKEWKDQENKANFSSDLALLRESVLFFLFVLTIGISGTVISTSLLRRSLLSFVPDDLFFIFPVEFVYIYGLLFTILLGALYIPLEFILRKKEKSFYSHEGKTDSIPTEKASHAHMVSGNKSYRELFKVLLSLFGPLISSILGTIP